MKDPCQEGNLLPDQSIRVAGPVVPLVVVPDERSLVGELVYILEDLFALDWVLVHEHPFLTRQSLWLEEDVITDADLADIVEETSPLELLELCLREVHRLPDLNSDARHVL